MRYAIIDIGSNAIRAVVYDNNSLGSFGIYNDKFRSDITTLLDFDTVDVKHQTYLILKYFIHIFKQLNVSQIKCVATAVLRGHPKADNFKKIVKEKYGLDIEILSGEEEAYLSAIGLISGVECVNGIAADLGGGSLELVEICNSKVGRCASLALGTKSLNRQEPIDLSLVRDKIASEFGESGHYDNLYLIGGAFRLIGRSYMEFVHYPLLNLHNLSISSDDLLIYLSRLEGIKKIKHSFCKRVIDANAITITQALIESFQIKTVLISNYGLKEGVRFINLPEEEKHKNIIYERCCNLVGFKESECLIDKYIDLILPLLVDPSDIVQDIIKFSIILSSYSKGFERALKSNFIVEYILVSDIPFSHRHRAMLAVVLSHAFYNPRLDFLVKRASKRILLKQDFLNSQIIGNVIKIAKDIDGPELKQPSFALLLKDSFVEVSASDILPKMIFEKICDKLREIAIIRKSAKKLLQKN